MTESEEARSVAARCPVRPRDFTFKSNGKEVGQAHLAYSLWVQRIRMQDRDLRASGRTSSGAKSTVRDRLKPGGNEAQSYQEQIASE